MRKEVYQVSKRLTRKWEIAQRACADLGFIGSEGVFVSWRGVPLTNPGWAVERPYLRKDKRFLERVGDITWPTYQLNNKVTYAYESTQKALSEAREVIRREKKLSKLERIANLISGNDQPTKRDFDDAQSMLESGTTAEKAKQSTDPRGFVYVITNPIYPGYVKIGKAFDVENRLNGYQTYDPFRRYSLEGSKYFDVRAKAEDDLKVLLSGYKGDAQGEWFRVSVETAVEKLQSMKKENGVVDPIG